MTPEKLHKRHHVPKVIYFGKKDSIIKSNSKNEIFISSKVNKEFDIDSVSRSSDEQGRDGSIFIQKKATIDYENAE